MILVLVACWIEQAFLFLPPERFEIQIIGAGPDCAANIRWEQAYGRVILVGTCGLLSHSHSKRELYYPNETVNWKTGERYVITGLDCAGWRVRSSVTTPFLVKDAATKEAVLEVENFDIVDMEDAYVAAVCAERQIPLSIIRYPIDYCDRPLKTRPVQRGLYRYYQHAKMQWRIRQCLTSSIK